MKISDPKGSMTEKVFDQIYEGLVVYTNIINQLYKLELVNTTS